MHEKSIECIWYAKISKVKYLIFIIMFINILIRTNIQNLIITNFNLDEANRIVSISLSIHLIRVVTHSRAVMQYETHFLFYDA